VRATGLLELSSCASAASNSGVIVLVDQVRNSGPYCRHVSAGSLSRANAPTTIAQVTATTWASRARPRRTISLTSIRYSAVRFVSFGTSLAFVLSRLRIARAAGVNALSYENACQSMFSRAPRRSW
jgi:hypothetical protein